VRLITCHRLLALLTLASVRAIRALQSNQGLPVTGLIDRKVLTGGSSDENEGAFEVVVRDAAERIRLPRKSLDDVFELLLTMAMFFCLLPAFTASLVRSGSDQSHRCDISERASRESATEAGSSDVFSIVE
jgi:hypothetical protein